MLKKIEKISLLCLLTWLNYKPSMAQTTPASNIVYSPKGVRAIEVRLYMQRTKTFSPAILFTDPVRLYFLVWKLVLSITQNDCRYLHKTRFQYKAIVS